MYSQSLPLFDFILSSLLILSVISIVFTIKYGIEYIKEKLKEKDND